MRVRSSRMCASRVPSSTSVMSSMSSPGLRTGRKVSRPLCPATGVPGRHPSRSRSTNSFAPARSSALIRSWTACQVCWWSRQPAGRNRLYCGGVASAGTTAGSAVFSNCTPIRRWRNAAGRGDYPAARRLLITADAGGSNGHRTRAWKTELAALAAGTGLEITVCHFPPGTSHAPPSGTRSSTGCPKLTNADRILATVLYLRRLCTQPVLGELLAVDRSRITEAIRETRPLLERHCRALTPATARFPAPADLIAFLAAAPCRIGQADQSSQRVNHLRALRSAPPSGGSRQAELPGHRSDHLAAAIRSNCRAKGTGWNSTGRRRVPLMSVR